MISKDKSAKATAKMTEEVTVKAKAARAASRLLSRMSADVKNRALLNIAAALESQQAPILKAKPTLD